MAKYTMTRDQLAVVTRYGLNVVDVLDGDVVCEVSHPNGVADVYIQPGGSIYVEEGDSLDGYEMVALEDSIFASRFN